MLGYYGWVIVCLILVTVTYCENGEEFNFVTGECNGCPRGEYQPPNTRDVCFKCDAGTSTRTEGTMSNVIDGTDVCFGKLKMCVLEFHLLPYALFDGYEKLLYKC